MSTLEERNLAIIEEIMTELGVSDIEELPAKVREIKEAAQQKDALDGLWDCANCNNRQIGGGFAECPNCDTARK